MLDNNLSASLQKPKYVIATLKKTSNFDNFFSKTYNFLGVKKLNNIILCRSFSTIKSKFVPLSTYKHLNMLNFVKLYRLHFKALCKKRKYKSLI